MKANFADVASTEGDFVEETTAVKVQLRQGCKSQADVDKQLRAGSLVTSGL